MAQRDYLQEKLSCCNCLNLLEDPAVFFSCGQSYCRKRVKSHWDKEEKKLVYSCPGEEHHTCSLSGGSEEEWSPCGSLLRRS